MTSPIIGMLFNLRQTLSIQENTFLSVQVSFPNATSISNNPLYLPHVS